MHVLLGLALLSAAALSYSRHARADEIADFQFALNAYDSGDYETAIKRFNKLLEQEITNKALLVEVLKYLAASHMFTGNVDEARKRFKELILKDPDYELDPVLFPTEVLDEYWRVKQEMIDELKKIEESKKLKQQELLEKKKKLKESWVTLVKMANHPPYIRQKVKTSNLFFSFVPFGVGQFQNGQNLKGYLFLSGEAALLIATVTTYWLSVYYYNQYLSVWPPVDDLGEEKPERARFLALSNGLGIANKVTFWLLIGGIVAGIIDAIVFFKKKRVTYEKVKESDVPKEYRVQPIEVPFMDLDDIVGDVKKDEKP
jgi:tetratricopeptide (TPR) repeat protein